MLTIHNVSHAQAAQAAFDRANEHFQEGNYAKAVRDYQTIVRGGYESGALYLNLGIAYTELDSLGMAKAWFMQAERFQETQQEAVQALDFIEAKFSRRAAILPVLPWERFSRNQLQQIGLKSIANYALVIFYLLSFCVLFYWFAPIQFKKWTRYTIIAVSVLFLLSLVNYFYASHLKINFGEAVSVVDEHNVYEQANEESAILSKAYEGYTFRHDRRKQENTDWLFVRMSNGVEGWIQKKMIVVF